MSDTITKEEFDAFRAQAAEVALASAKKHGLCEVVQKTLCKAGFADVLPPLYQVYAKYSPNGSWGDVDSDYSDLDKARAAAQRVRKEGIAHVKRSAQYDLEYRHSSVTLNPTRLTVEEAQRQAAEAVRAYQRKKRQAAGEDTAYPKVKVVQKVWQDNGRTKTETVEFVK